MFDKNLTKPKVTFIVNKEGALQATGGLTVDATGAINLSNGEVGLINKSTAASDAGVKIPLNAFFDGTDATLIVPEIKIVQGTSNSLIPPSDNRPGVKRSFESSATIQADEKIWINIKAAKPATYSIVGVDAINVSDEVEYRFRIAFQGRYHDIMYSGGTTSVPVYSPYYISPDYSQLITDGTLTGTSQALDHLVKNLVVEANRNSSAFSYPQINKGGSQLVMALALNDNGVATGTVTVAVGNTTITSVTVAGVVLTAGTAFAIGGTNAITATNIASAINGNATLSALGVKASAALGVVTVTAPGTQGNAVTLSRVGADLSVSGATLTGGFGTAIATLAAGTAVPIFAYNGPNSVVTKSYAFNAEQVASLKASYPNETEVIILADVSSIQNVAQAEEIAFIALDRPGFLAEDRLKESKVRIEVGLTSGFTTATTTKLSNAFEGQGYPKQVKTWYQETQERRDNDIQFRGVEVQKIQYPHDVLDITVPQDIVVITHSTTKQGAIGTRDVNLQSTIVLTDATLSGGIPSGTLNSDTSILPTAVEDWARANGAHIQVTYDA